MIGGMQFSLLKIRSNKKKKNPHLLPSCITVQRLTISNDVRLEVLDQPSNFQLRSLQMLTEFDQ